VELEGFAVAERVGEPETAVDCAGRHTSCATEPDADLEVAIGVTQDERLVCTCGEPRHASTREDVLPRAAEFERRWLERVTRRGGLPRTTQQDERQRSQGSPHRDTLARA
jgi:hypothetical protein